MEDNERIHVIREIIGYGSCCLNTHDAFRTSKVDYASDMNTLQTIKLKECVNVEEHHILEIIKTQY